ncbi:conserved protein of unknown function [Acetoanaerobium sticklandii]|uniref:BsuBI/PstI restriction endonuclease domain-containing protein n=1 Tax=Acetoanaerobium sticklandii (strain ATCC 12662 / DSM 519 / JCM 1433 / CCUG 9281 / NCIMB 10654 / HF) TaxID=499177 RepID=E3PVU3_ACESD|nr:BsuBI/PstI family type II restriction endonuclease [Acetoanaerobium sticklandii]CBH22646.1 conserved protein of unknown function [Acetoanaerobium sticklandii]
MNLFKGKEKVDDYFVRLRVDGYQLKNNYHGITLDMVTRVLTSINRYTADIRDVVWCLLNDEIPSLYANANGFRICDGASVAHIGGFVGILLRGGNRLDREGRDYWIKPLVDIGAVNLLTLKNGQFLSGHLVAKSPNSCYRLTDSFISLLKSANSPQFDNILNQWISIESTNKRLEIQAHAVRLAAQNSTDNAHKKLIQQSITIYANHFLPDYIPVYVDDSDGDRITVTEREKLNFYGISFGHLDDVWPDAILVNPNEKKLWFIEAVTSDGEVDEHKMRGLKAICYRSNLQFGGATTTYPTWKKMYSRQKSEDNLAVGSYVWIKESPERHMYIE